jgi:PhoD-like phosphatase
MPRLLIGPVLRHVGTTDATVFVETDAPCEVEILGCREQTWLAGGHHYALVTIEGLQPATATPYDVRLDAAVVWPPLDSDRPPSRIRTLGHDDRQIRLAFGSCRHSRASAQVGDKHFDADSLAAYSRELANQDERTWPDGILMLGDQVYADETTEATQRRIRAKREITKDGPGTEVADFEEYTWLYLESWTDPDVRWIMSTIGTSMIFDDHDVRDDWNTSHEWREDMQQTSWWQDRIVGGLSTYWIYQHLGNLSPDELRQNELYQKIRTHRADVAGLLRDFAIQADREADGAKGTRWSYRRDFGRVRLLMIDSRCGRILADGQRSMVSDDEFAWIEQQTDGDYDHLLIGTSLPWLLGKALHDLEAWDEVLCDDKRRKRVARFGEWLRRAADLEHWASFGKSFERLGELIASVGRRANPPASICVLSGDVHHAYSAEVHFRQPVTSRVYQLTCSPLHNYVPFVMKIAFRIFWSRFVERTLHLVLGLVAKVPPPSFSWTRLNGPFFGNEMAEFVAQGRRAYGVIRTAGPVKETAGLDEVARVTLAA